MEDNKIKYAGELEKLRLRKEMKASFYALIEAKRERWQQSSAERAALRSGVASDDEADYTVTEDIVETVIKTVEQNAE